ncbi:MAG: serine/threonine-protein kinase [Planctomycetota bacterium]
MMDDLWQRARSVLEDLLDLGDDERRDRVEAVRLEDEALADLVLELLDADEAAAESFLPVDGTADHLGEADGAERRRIGPFQLIRRLATGRTSTIWIAERADGAFVQDVAIKLIDTEAVAQELGMDLDAARGHERGLLARVDHPGVVRIVDAGDLEGDVEWIAMEHLECEPMLDRSDRLGQGIEERVRQIAALADAVEACHRASVLHLDVAPGNAVATADGHVKLIDFGSARSLDGGEPGAEGTPGPVTPAFAAPEQWDGRDLGPAADVHALGALLFASLTGRPPFEVEGVSIAEAKRRVRWDEPPSPARAADRATVEVAAARGTTPRALARSIRRGGLDAVALAALAKEPAQRTQTAAAFADDLRRWLDGEPVHARRESTTQRVARLARRRPGATLAVVAAVVALLGGSIALFSAADRARAAEAREQQLEAAAERSLDSLRAAARLLVVDVYESLQPQAGTRHLLDQIVAAGIEISEGQTDPELSLWLGDALVKRSLQSADAARSDVRTMDAALADIDRAVELIEPERTAHPAFEAPSRVAWTAELARSVILADICRNDEARAALVRARAIVEGFQPAPDDRRGLVSRANARASIGLSASSLGGNTGRWEDWRAAACDRAEAYAEVLELNDHAPAYVEIGLLASSIECASLSALATDTLTDGIEDARTRFEEIAEIANRYPRATNFVASLQRAAFALADWHERLDEPGEALDVLVYAEEIVAPRIEAGGNWNAAGVTLGVIRTRVARDQIASDPAPYRSLMEASEEAVSDSDAVAEGMALLAREALSRGELVDAVRLCERALTRLDEATNGCAELIHHSRAQVEAALVQALIDERLAGDADGPRRDALFARSLEWTRKAAEWHARGTGDALHALAMEERRQTIEQLIERREAIVAGND